MRHRLRHSSRGAAILDYILISSILFFIAVTLLTLVDSMARGYFQAAQMTSGAPAIDVDPQVGAGFAPCGPHSTLGRTDLGGVAEECY